MTRDTILEALKNALNHGTGDLNDLDNLLIKVREDIEEVRQEEAEAKRKAEAEAEAKRQAEYKRNGEKIAAMATRMLESQLTEDDVAMVLETYLRQQGMDIKVNGKDIVQGIKMSNEWEKNLDDLMDSIKEFYATITTPFEKKGKQGKSADEIIAQYLKKNGL